jgi:predicted GIY-YIG superfamily endonuclease
MGPDDLARELGIDRKQLRGWLRHRWPRRPEERGLAWHLTDEQVAEIRHTLPDVRQRSSRLATARPARRPADPPAIVITAPASAPLAWPDLQLHANAVLASGLRDLLGQRATSWGQVDAQTAGVYVVADEDVTIYVGESTFIARRVAQHRDAASNMTAALRVRGVPDPGADVSARLRIRTQPVEIGRLELEEFAIACLRPSMNKMRRASRSAFAYADADPDLWRRVQYDCATLLHEGVSVGCDVPSVSWSAMRPPTDPGVYILRNAEGAALYVGETDALAERLGTHAGERSYFSALRRHVGTELLGLAFATNVRRGFSPPDESAITAFLATCSIAILPLSFGRWELERELVHELQPALNREHAYT